MAHYLDTIELAVPMEAAFDYLADFSNAAHWDPSVIEAKVLTPGKIRAGSRFRLLVSFLGRSIPLEYEITSYQRPSRLVFKGGDDAVSSIDEINFVLGEWGEARITYEARLELKGFRRMADPILDLLFQRMGRLAMHGLEREVLRACTKWHQITSRNPKTIQVTDKSIRPKLRVHNA